MQSTGFLRFVRSKEEENLMKEAAEALQQKGMELLWVDEGEVTVEKECIYVLGVFDSIQYKSLVGKCRIVGPLVILAHIEHGWPLPTSLQPVFSMAMHGVVACFTQAGTKKTRERLVQLVKLMGGRVEGNLTRRVTHLIAGEVGSTKYHVARQYSLPILRPSWVEWCWQEGLSHSVDAKSQSVLSQHRCLPFTGCTITVTGLDEGLRQKVKEACQKNGGNYSGELTKGVCTHLLVGSKTSTKYKFAREWKIYCVDPDWFNDSVTVGYCMPEQEYATTEQGVAKGQGRGRPTNQKSFPEWATALESFKIPDIAGDEFLDGCKLYLCGFTERQMEKLSRLVNRGGGVRFSQLGEKVTHVVMGEQEADILKRARELDTGVYVVSALWLLDCCAQGEKLPEAKYSCAKGQPPSLQAEPQPFSSNSTRKRSLGDGDHHISKRLRVPEESDQEEEDDIMGQYAALPPADEGGDREEEDAPPLASGVLGGCRVGVSCLFSGEDQERVKEVLRRNGGHIVSPKAAIHILAPLQWVESKLSGEESGLLKRAVTMIWLQRSIEAGSLLDPASYFLFQPMTTPISASTLTDCVLAFSQFTDLEREHLIRFSKGLGAVVQDHFARYPAHGLLSTTHLILKSPTGNKFSSACKWGIPAVADSWLFGCALAQRIVSVQQHLITNVNPEPSTSVNPESSEGGTSKEKGVSDLPIQSRGEASGSHGEEASDKMEVDGGDENLSPPQLMNDVVICFNKKLSSLATLEEMAQALGARHCQKLDQTVTHYIHQGKAGEDRQVKMAKERGCFVVSPHWLIQSHEKWSRQHEDDYPITYNPSLALHVSMPSSTQSQIPIQNLELDQDQLSDTSSGSGYEETREGQDQVDENLTSDPLKAVRQLQQHLDELREAPREQQKKRRSRRLQEKDLKGDPVIPPTSPVAHMKGRGRRNRRGRMKEEEQLTDSQISDSQLLQVTYDDPESRREKAKLLAQIEREEELLAQGIHPSKMESRRKGKPAEELRLELPPLVDEKLPTTAGNLPVSNAGAVNGSRLLASTESSTAVRSNKKDLNPSVLDVPPIGVPIVTHSTTKPADAQPLYDERSKYTRTLKPKFLLSSLEQREKIDYGALIQELSGEYIDQDYFTNRCTHLVVGKASRTEKFLGACASGKWVLHKSYLEECRSAKRFVWEEGHEWGERGEGTPLEVAPRRWRLELAKAKEERSRRNGAFMGWKVLVFAEKGKLPGLKRLLESGGAAVVGSHTPSALKGVTHAFITMNHFPKASLSLEDLAKQGILCLKPEYIAEYLCRGKEVTTEPFLLHELKK